MQEGSPSGDPLSPLLYVGTSDLFRTMINHHFCQGNLNAPLPILGHDFPVIQYADDAIVIMEACPTQVGLINSLINMFPEATGLKIELSKIEYDSNKLF